MAFREEVIKLAQNNAALRPHLVPLLRATKSSNVLSQKHPRKTARLVCISREQSGQIPFPPEYEETLRSKDKSQTIRVGDEKGVYQEGVIYEATSYEDEPWGIYVRVLKVVHVGVDSLADWGIPEEDISRVMAEGDGSDQVEIIQFDVL